MTRSALAMCLIIISAPCLSEEDHHDDPLCISLMAREYFCQNMPGDRWCQNAVTHAVVKRIDTKTWQFTSEAGDSTTAFFRDTHNMQVNPGKGWLQMTAVPNLCQFPATIDFRYGTPDHLVSRWSEVPGQR
jgi:hypothetical protein